MGDHAIPDRSDDVIQPMGSGAPGLGGPAVRVAPLAPVIGTAALELLDAVRLERAALRKAEGLHAREHATGFNMVALLRPGETALSEVFRWMLDERGSHGQGDVFRELFFEAVPGACVAGADWRGATATCEAPTRDGRRIDLLLESADGLTALVIENKPWAGWQARQLESYRADQSIGREPGRVKVLALVGRCDDPQAHAEAHWRAHRDAASFPAGDVIGVGFGPVANWVERCAAVARPAKVTALLRDLAAFVRTEVEGVSAVDDDAMAAVIVEGGAARIRAALEVGASLPAVLRRLSTSLVDQLDALDGFAGRWRATPTVEGSKSFGVTPRAMRGPMLAYALFDMAGGFRPWVGLVATPEQGDAYDLSALKLGRDGRWLRWEYLTDADAGLLDAHAGVIDGRLAPDLLAHAERLVVKLRKGAGTTVVASTQPG